MNGEETRAFVNATKARQGLANDAVEPLLEVLAKQPPVRKLVPVDLRRHDPRVAVHVAHVAEDLESAGNQTSILLVQLGGTLLDVFSGLINTDWLRGEGIDQGDGIRSWAVERIDEIESSCVFQP